MTEMHKCWKYIETPSDDLAIGQIFRLYRARVGDYDYYFSINEHWISGTTELRVVSVRYDANPGDDIQELYYVFISDHDFETDPEALDVRVQKMLGSDDPYQAANYLKTIPR